jgi:thioredoxin 1
MSVVNIKEGEFKKEVLESDKPVIVDFYADWCGPCKAMAPIFEEMSGKLEGKVKFAKLNVDTDQMTAQEYGVMSIPTLMIFKNGEVVETMMGLQDGDSLIEKLNTL